MISKISILFVFVYMHEVKLKLESLKNQLGGNIKFEHEIIQLLLVKGMVAILMGTIPS